MKKVLSVFFLLAAIPLFVGTALCAAAYSPAASEISVEINQGGTAVIIPEVNCPIPGKTELELKDGESGRFNIQFTEPGVYTYTVKTLPDSRNLDFDSSVYTVKIYVTDENGSLSAVTLIYANGVKYAGEPGADGGLSTIVFKNKVRAPEDTTSPGSTTPVIPEETTAPESTAPAVTERTTSAGGKTPVLPERTTVPGGNTPASPERTTSFSGITSSAPQTATFPAGISRPHTPERTTSPRSRTNRSEQDETTAPAREESKPAPADKRNPKTSDDSDMEMYFLIAMAASAGLLILSIIYAADCRKLIKNKKNGSRTDT